MKPFLRRTRVLAPIAGIFLMALALSGGAAAQKPARHPASKQASRKPQTSKQPPTKPSTSKQQAAQQTAPGAAAVPPALAALQQSIQQILTRYGVPGAGIALVAKDHVIWEGGVGMARLATKTRVTADTMFRVGSITKSFVALALLQLQEKKKIDLNARLRELAPTLPFRNPWSSHDPVTVAEVLEHTAGFDDMPPSEVYNLSSTDELDPFQVSKRFSETLVSRWPPGTRMAYSNPDYGVAGYLVWKASGQQFGPYIEQNILQPLGMTDSGFKLTDTIDAKLAQGYHGNPPRAVPFLHIYLRSAGGLKSSPAEMAKLVQMFLNGGKAGKQQIVTPASIQRMEYPETTMAARAGLKYGYGLANYSDLDGPVVQHGHDGGISGYLSSYRYMPDQGVGYVALINNDSGGPALRKIDQLLANYLLTGKTLPKPPTGTMTSAQLREFTGYYEKENPRNQMIAFLAQLIGGAHVSLSGGRLYLKEAWFSRRKALVPTGDNQFRLEKQVAPSMIFLKGPSGKEILSTAGPGGFFGTLRGAAWPRARLALILLALLLVLSSFAFAVWWIPWKLAGKLKDGGDVPMRLMPLLAGLCLLGAFLIVNGSSVWVLGNYDMASMGVCLLTWAFAAFSGLGLVVAWRGRWLPRRRAPFWHGLAVTIACCGLTIYMAYWHLLGIQLWKP